MAYFEAEYLGFEKIEKLFWNGSVENFSSVAINYPDFMTRKCLENIEISYFLALAVFSSPVDLS